MEIDTSQNWRLVLNPQTVLLHSKTANGVFAPPLSVDNAKQRAVSAEDIGIDPALAQRGTVWHLWKDRIAAAAIKANVQAPEPKKGDQIEAAGTVWLIKSVLVQSLGERYRLVCARAVG